MSEISSKNVSFTMYLDESGDHLLHTEEDYLANPNLETHCSLLGLIIPDVKKPILKKTIKEIKNHFWKDDKVIFHNVEIRHRKGIFVIFHYLPDLYEEFKKRMNHLFDEIKPRIICSSLNKREWIRKFPKKIIFQDDPYEEAFTYLLERYANFLNSCTGTNVIGRISVEARTQKQDKSLRKTYLYVKNYGTQYYKASHFNRLSDKIDFKSKSFNISGAQLSDYCSYPYYINHKYPSRKNLQYEYLKKYNFYHKKYP